MCLSVNIKIDHENENTMLVVKLTYMGMIQINT